MTSNGKATDQLGIWCMCDRASYMKMTRGTNLMQQLWFIIINISTCFGHLYVHFQECRLCTAACGVQHCKRPGYLLQCWTPHAAVHNLHSRRWTYRCPKHVELFMIINYNCCVKLVPLVMINRDLQRSDDVTMRYFRLPPQCRWDLRSSAILRGVQEKFLDPWRWDRYVVPKRRYGNTTLPCVISQKM